MKDYLLLNLNNILGFRTKKKIVVFESDDWGSIRMPSKNTYQKLIRKNLGIEKSKYDALDCLENKDDLYNLFELLLKYSDKHGKSPIFTFNTVMANPDFEKIRNDNFNNYYYESLFKTYSKHYSGDYKYIWEEGIEKKIIQPQFHAREHVNVSLWMKDLQQNKKETRLAFEHDFFGLKTNTSSPYQNHYLAAYNVENFHELENLKKIIEDGLKLFKKEFNFSSESIIPCNYVWPIEIERVFAILGIKSIQGQRAQIVPNLDHDGKKSVKRHYTGQKNKLGQTYTIRNVKFEPYENENLDWLSNSLAEIKNSFFWKKPAIISTHRINYVGGMDINHRDKNLNLLDQLIKKILNIWPDVEFLSSDELSRQIISYNENFHA